MLMTIAQKLGEPPILITNGLSTAAFAFMTFITEVYMPIITAGAMTAGFIASALGSYHAYLKIRDRLKGKDDG